jgi:hypothetical protein
MRTLTLPFPDDALPPFVDVQQDLASKLPPDMQQDCTITGPVSYSTKPLY